MLRTVLEPGKQTDIIGLDIVTLEAGGSLDLTREEELAVVVLSGVVDASVDGVGIGRAGGRSSVFEAPGDTIYAPPSAVGLTAVSDARVAVVAAPLADAPAAAARIIRPADQSINDVGEGAWGRTVRTILGPDDAAGRLLLGETINAPGAWSSYPPHKHDTHEPPREVKLEEIYYFELDPPEGFGIQLLYEGADGAPEREEAFTVRTGDAAAIRSGYHPVVGAPGYRLYYLWAMAGIGRQMAPNFDPRYRWVQFGS